MSTSQLWGNFNQSGGLNKSNFEQALLNKVVLIKLNVKKKCFQEDLS